MWWKKVFKHKKSPEHDLKELVEALQGALGTHLKSVVLFGSLASGEFHEEHSDVNVLIVTDLSYDILHQMSPAFRRWMDKGHVMPVLVAPPEWADFARAFPIEFHDMLDHHRVIYGEDPLTGLSVSAHYLQAQCEHELALKQLKLRQAVTMVGGQAPKLRQLLIDSWPSVLSLLRGVLRLEEKMAKLSKLEAAKRLAERVGFDPTCLEGVEGMRFRRETDNVDDIATHYLEILEKVLAYVRRKR